VENFHTDEGYSTSFKDSSMLPHINKKIKDIQRQLSEQALSKGQKTNIRNKKP
jgi:hypothetical protein